MNQLYYNVIFQKEEDGGYTASVPALSGCISYGKSLEEAQVMIKDAIMGYLESVEKHGQAIPIESESFVGAVMVPLPIYA